MLQTAAKSKRSEKCSSAPESYQVILKLIYEMVVALTCFLVLTDFENELPA